MSILPTVLPFDDSRRLTGSNLYFEGAGAVLETVGIVLDGYGARIGNPLTAQRDAQQLGAELASL